MFGLAVGFFRILVYMKSEDNGIEMGEAGSENKKFRDMKERIENYFLTNFSLSSILSLFVSRFRRDTLCIGFYAQCIDKR